MNKIICIIFLFFEMNTVAQNNIENKTILYGTVSKEQLMAPPYSQWFDTNYSNYHPDERTLADLRLQKTKDISVKVFFGTWCGDSQREVPRFIKLLEQMFITNVQLIAVGKSDSLYKQSPQHEEEGLGIYRVPTFIIYKKGIEVNRINEFPVLSAEKDLFKILNGLGYTPNYPSFMLINKWINDSTFNDPNISIRGLVRQVRPLVHDEHELNNLGYVLLALHKKEAALKIFRINFNLYYESASVSSSLGEGFYENGDNENAVYYLENALRLNKKPEDVRGILNILYKAKGIK